MVIMSTIPKKPKSVQVKAIRYLGKQNVYNMEVKDHHNFSINGGLIVHNCGYGLVSYHVSKSGKIVTPKMNPLPPELRTEEDHASASVSIDPYATW